MILDRLKIVMSHFGLTPSSLADAIGVPRSSISHLLSGRNKPSLDFVLKLVKTYPEVNLYWLLNGKGDFPAKAQKDHMPQKEVVSAERKAAIPPIPSQHTEKSISKIVIFFADGTFETYEPKK